MSLKYRWSEDLYDTISFICVSLTNCLIDLNPLRARYGDRYMRYRNLLSNIGIEKKPQRSEAQSNYRENRRRRLSMKFRQHLDFDDEETQQPID